MGVLFTGAAILLHMVAVDFAGMKKFSKLGFRTLENMAQAACVLAVISFGLAMMGASVGTADFCALSLFAALGGGLLEAAYTLASWGANASRRAMHGFTVIAICSTVVYGFLVLGTIASIDAEVIR